MALLRTIAALAAIHGVAASVGTHLLDATEPTVHRGVAPSELIALDDLLRPFTGRPTIAVRIHHDDDAAKQSDGVAEGMVSALRRDGLPQDPKEAAAIVATSKVPLSIALQFEHLSFEAWPAAIQEIVAPFGDTSVRAEVDGGLLVHAYLSSPGAAALPAHEDLGDIIVLQLMGEKTWNFASEYPTLAPGDGLALPSGTRHSARATSEGPSVHLTIHRIAPDQVATRRLDEDDDPRFSCFASTDASCGACRDENGEVDCDDCEYCTDADTVCISDVPDTFNDDRNICCLSVGYKIERADEGECENLFDDVDPDDLDEGDDSRGFSENELFCETSLFSKKECDKYDCCSWDGVSGSSGCDYSGGSCPVTKVKRDKCKKSKKDDKDWSYFTTDGKRQTCKDVAKKPQKRCARIGENLVPAKDACCKACKDYDDCEWSRTSGGCQKVSSYFQCKEKDGKDDSKWFYKKERKDCKWAKKKGKCGKYGEDRKGRRRTGYESCCKSCKS